MKLQNNQVKLLIRNYKDHLKLRLYLHDFQFDYKGVPGQALLTYTRYFFRQRYKRNIMKVTCMHV